MKPANLKVKTCLEQAGWFITTPCRNLGCRRHPGIGVPYEPAAIAADYCGCLARYCAGL